ncbi:MAG: hypothetical protein V1494_00660 [Candidatus Diapherotrites archaeon]
MFHMGKVSTVISPKSKEVLSSDSSTQAVVKMWDENLLTLLVEESIAQELKENDIVLVNYRPASKAGGQAVPKMTVCKILRGKLAKKTWEEFAAKNKGLKDPAKQPQGQAQQPHFSQIH